jgi:cytochrome c oxidase assembly protein subunit 11
VRAFAWWARCILFFGEHMDKSVAKTVVVCAVISLMMLVVCFSMVPLYSALCRATGLNGSVNLTVASSDHSKVNDLREMTMQFVTTTNENLAWDFYPRDNSMTIHPEENYKMIFHVKNNSRHTMTVQAVPSITPWQAATHLHKIQCFCFTQQTLKAGESLDMPVIFRIDNKVPGDIQTVTLAYTLFDVTTDKQARSAA